MRQEAAVGREQGGSRNFLFLASPGIASPLLPPRHPFPRQERRPVNPWRGPWSLPGPAQGCVPRPPHLMSVAQGARAGFPRGPAGPGRLQAALPRGRGLGRLPRALRPMALGPTAPAHSVPGTFSRRGPRRRRRRRRRQAGGCAPAGTRAVDTHVEGGRGGARGDPPGPGPAPEVTGTRSHCSTHGWRPVTPEAQAGAGPPRCPQALPQRTHPATGARAPGHPGAPASCTARAPAAAARTSLCSQPDKAPARGPLHRLPETGLCHMSLGTLPNTPTYAHTPTRPRTHGQGRAQTRAVAETLAFTDTR